jgi:hypothetical protein
LTYRIAGYTIIPSDTKIVGNSFFIVLTREIEEDPMVTVGAQEH